MDTWILLTGSWGDIFAGYGNLCQFLDAKGIEKANVVYFGLDADICTFLKAQPRINEVKHLLISEPAVFYKYNRMAATDFDQFLEVTGLAAELPQVQACHVSNFYLEQHTDLCNREIVFDMPSVPADWWMFLSRKRPYILVQPYSIRSVTFDQHWPHWVEALEWLFENTDMNVVLAGEITSKSDPAFTFPWLEHERLVNIVGQTKSMIDVLHIATWAQGVITTSNALSMWSIVGKESKGIQLPKVPTLTVCHNLIKERAPYYYNWIHSEPNTVLDSETDLNAFTNSCREWLARLEGGLSAVVR